MPPRHLRDTDNDPAVIAQLRHRRASFEEIAAHLGITQAQAAELYRQTLAGIPGFETAELRTEEVLLADDAIRRLMTIARADGTSARTAVEAWNSIRGWAEHKGRLLGLAGTQAKDETTPSKLHAIRAARRA